MIYAETSEPFFREDNGFQMIAYFGWQVASVARFINLEINYQIPNTKSGKGLSACSTSH